MYIGKPKGVHGNPEKPPEQRIILPENYAGNAFLTEPPVEEEPKEEKKTAPCEDREEESALPVYLPSQKGRGSFLPKLDRLFSSDALLILLAILLSGSEDGADLAVILLLLLLF